MKTTYLIAAALLATSTSLWAQDDAVIQLSLTPKIALYPSTTRINGFALNIWGENPQTSFNLGLVNGSTRDSGGLSLAIINFDQSYEGVQLGVFNYSWENFTGWQSGLINVAHGNFEGLQTGAVNVGGNTSGLQLGLINYSEHLNGLQIGAINVAMDNPWFTEFPSKLAQGFPIVNWSF